MRLWIVLVALMLAGCATAQTPAPPPPTVQPTLPPDNSAQNNTPADSQPTQDTAAANVTPDASISEADAAATATMQAQLVDLPTLSAAAAIQNEIQMMPPPGTLELVPETEEPDPNATPIPIYSITYEERGGPANTSLLVEIFGDGRVLRDGAEVAVGADVIQEAAQAIHDLGFFNIEGVFTRAGASPDIYTYMVRVELEDGAAKRIEAQDGIAPPELLRLFRQLRSIGL